MPSGRGKFVYSISWRASSLLFPSSQIKNASSPFVLSRKHNFHTWKGSFLVFSTHCQENTAVISQKASHISAMSFTPSVNKKLSFSGNARQYCSVPVACASLSRIASEFSMKIHLTSFCQGLLGRELLRAVCGRMRKISARQRRQEILVRIKLRAERADRRKLIYFRDFAQQRVLGETNKLS